MAKRKKNIKADIGESKPINNHLKKLSRVIGETADNVIITNKEKTITPLRNQQSKTTHFVSTGKNITKRKKVENELHKQKDLLQKIIDNIPHSIYWKDLKSRYLGCNLNHALKAGFKNPKKIIGKNDYDLPWKKEETKYYRAMDKKVIESKTPLLDFEQSERIADGSQRIILTSKVPLMDNKKNVTGILGIDADITDRKNMENELQYRTKFENLINHISSNFINLKTNNIDKGINAALKKIGEFAKVDRSYIFLFNKDGSKMSNTHEWCAPKITALIEKLQGIRCSSFSWFMKKIKKSKIVYVLSVKDLPKEAKAEKKMFKEGNIKSLINVPMVYGGKLIGFLGFVSVKLQKTWTRDIISLLTIVGEIFVNTLERKNAEDALLESENKYRSLYSKMNEGMALKKITYDESNKAIDYIILDVNPAFETITGMKKEEVIGKKGSEIFQKKSPPNLEMYQKVTKTQKSTTFESFFEPLNKHLLISVFLLGDNKFATSYTDITQRKHAEKKLIELYKHLGVINRQISILFNLKAQNVNRNKEEIPKFIVESAKNLSHAKYCALFKFNQKNRFFELIAGKNIGKEGNKSINCIKISSSPLLKLLSEKKTRIQGTLDQYKLKNLNLYNSLKYFLLLPLHQGSKFNGALFLGFSKKKTLTTQELEFFDVFAMQASLSLLDNF